MIRTLFALTSFLVLTLSGCGDGGGGGDGFRYTALGASDAVGIGASPLSNGYVFRIEDRVEELEEDVSLLNLGIPGAEIGEIKNIEVPVAEEEPSDLITLFAGGNDIVDGDDPAAFERDLEEVLSRLRSAHPESLIVVANLPDMTRLPRFIEDPSPEITTARVAAFNAAIARQAARVGAPVADLFGLGITEALVSEDGFHPSDEGHRQIAEAFLREIEPRL